MSDNTINAGLRRLGYTTDEMMQWWNDYLDQLCEGAEALTGCAKNRNFSTIRANAVKHLVITDGYRKVSCLQFRANPLYS